MGMLNFSARKKFTRSGAALTIGVEDIFSSGNLRAIVDVPEDHYYAEGYLQYRKRIFKVTFSQPLGNRSLRDKRSRATASEAEQRRVND